MKNTISYSTHGVYELPGLLILGKLNARLEQIDHEANEMINELTKKLKSLEGITEKLKAEDQLAWVQAMNSIRNRAEETVLHELINK